MRSQGSTGAAHTSCAFNLCALILFALALSACQPDSPRASHKLTAQGLYAGALSADAEFSLIGSLNHGASLWRNSDHERLYNWNHQSGELSDLVAAGFSPDGSRAITTDPRTLVVWDTATGEPLAFWSTPSSVLDVAMVGDGKLVVVGMEDHSAVLFDAESGRHIHTLLHAGVVGSVDVDVEGNWALTGSDDETAVLWSLRNGNPIHTFALDDPVRVVALSATGGYILSASQGKSVKIWSGITGEALHELTDHNQGVASATFSHDERLLLLGYVNQEIELWDVDTRRPMQTWTADSTSFPQSQGAAILAVGFAANNVRFYAPAGDGRLVELQPS